MSANLCSEAVIVSYVYGYNQILIKCLCLIAPLRAGVKKSKNIHLSPGQVHQNFYLSCYQITCPCQGKDKQALNFLLVRRTLGENICLSCLKFNLSRAPGQVNFLPLAWLYDLALYRTRTLLPNAGRKIIDCFYTWLYSN